MFKQIDARFYASEQIGPAEVAAAARQGIGTIVNNRPDGEDPDAPQSDAIAAAARDAGIAYVAIPVGHAGFSHPQVDAMAAAIARADAPILGYCKSGTRSTMLWALAEAKVGRDPDDITAAAQAGGYDLAPIRAMIDALTGGA